MDLNNLSRRSLMQKTSLLAAGAVAAHLTGKVSAIEMGKIERVATKGRIRQSVSRWCYGKWSLDELCEVSKRLGIQAIDLLGPEEFETVKKHGLICSLVNTHSLTDGLADKKFHEQCLAKLRQTIDATAAAGFPTVISFSGNRRGIPDDVGVENAVEALKRIAGYAEQKKVTIVLEYLNSKINHKDYMFDRTAWGVEVCKRVGSDRVKILYDIYHAQIMEGDIIRTIRENKDYIGHYHTGGNPGRNEIDETQELYYPAIMRAIAETGFDGYVAHEFVPKGDPLAALTYATRICDV
ncbi:MAG TPA: TIM barrel protein [Sedimentisphaerales bacterium]|nr:TIM barrel protein [Sedimentisphaerales bacterium]HRS09911.1 TIM barrel protein [Sedimentisphaerales bacterium]HRV46439.1 TIM barrel protein [Sedimentisphaerales bacterium]